MPHFNNILCSALTFAILAIGSFALGSPAFAQEAATYEYTIKKGETCAKIAKQELGNRRRYDVIHKFNPGMGPPPHVLKAGDKLKLPKKDSSPDARVTSVARRVQARAQSEANWRSASRGLGLYSGWRVNTLEKSEAELTFKDTSVFQMRENTLVIIYGGESKTARRRSGRATLERGTLRSHLGDLRMQVETPSSKAEFNGGDAIVSVDDSGVSRVSNHEGGSATVRSNDGGRVRVKPGFGSKVVKGKRPSKPKPLPPAPKWLDGPESFVGLAGQGATVRGAWGPVAVARSYRVEILKDKTVVASTEVPSTVSNFEIHRLPAGQYSIRLATIDGDFFESRPSKSKSAVVQLVTLDVPGPDAAPQEIDLLATEVPQTKVLPGTKISAPDGVVCLAGDNTVLSDTGKQTINCKQGDVLVGTLEVLVVEPEFEISVAGKTVDELTVARGESVDFSVRSISEDIEVPSLTFVPPDGFTVSNLRQADGAYYATVTATEGASEEALLAIVPEGEEQSVGELSVLVVEEEVEQEEEDPEPEEEEEEDPDPNYVQDAMGSFASPHLMGLVDESRRGSGASIAIHNVGESPSESYWRTSLALELSVKDKFRLGVAMPLDFSLEDAYSFRGDRDLNAFVGYHILRGQVGLYAELGVWIPLGTEDASIEFVSLTPSISLSVYLADRVYLRTRQGGIFDMSGNGRLAWASAYGADVRLVGALSLGIEADLVLGADREQVGVTGVTSEFISRLGVGVGPSMVFGPISVSLMARYGILDNGNTSQLGKLSFGASIRANFR